MLLQYSVQTLLSSRPVVRMEEYRNAFKSLIGCPPGKRPLGRPRRRWKDNIRMNLKEIGIGLIRVRIGIIGEPL